MNTSGKLVYTPDSKGNIVPDFSGVGYMNSEVAIPTIAVVKTVNPVAGDNLANIQSAIDEVAAMPVDNYGFRGAILFKKGKYLVSDTIKISASGIVLRGEGTDSSNGTHFVATKQSQYILFYFCGSGVAALSNSSKKAITDVYVPIGTKQVTVATGHNFKIGNTVMLHRIPNQSWIDLLTMAQWGWSAVDYDIYYERKVTAVSGNVISLDAPVVDVIDTTYAKGEVIRYSSTRIEKCGIENMALSSLYASDTAENHGWEAVGFKNIINGWARNLVVYYFGFSAVHVWDGAGWITVQDSKMIDPKSIITGGRRYSFNIDGQRSLVQRCTTRRGRHDFVNGSRTPGPSVFYSDTATIQNADIGPHHRWSTGILFDNLVSNGNQNIQNRTSSGSGHGWAGGQIMYWNCKAGAMIIQDPQGDARNWAIGCTATTITNVGDMVTEPLGIVESKNKRITAIPSLFKMQLIERFPSAAKQPQTISFDTLATSYLSTPAFSPNAKASSGLTVGYTSSNTAVATIVAGKIQIVGIGKTIITAVQAGDTTYQAAPNYGQLLTVMAAPLPIRIVDFKAIKTKEKAVLNWRMIREANERAMLEVQRSFDGVRFQTLAAINPIEKTDQQFVDSISGVNSRVFYRLKVIENGGTAFFSNTIQLKDKGSIGVIKLFPNPTLNTVTLSGLGNGPTELVLVQLNGKVIKRFTVQANTTKVDLTDCAAGSYMLKINQQDQQVQWLPVTKQ